MTRFTSVCLALASAVCAAAVVHAARPQYGGTLRLETSALIRSFDPATRPADALETALRRRLMPLVFETLTRIDADNGLEPGLALAWESAADDKRWRIRLRPGVTVHDGSPLQAWQVATSLRTVESRWRVNVDGDTLVLDLPEPQRDLPWLLADPRYAVTVRSGDALLGTGSFRMDRLESSALTLRAYDGHRQGRPFLDVIRVEAGRPLASQLADLEAGRADVVGLRATDTRRVTERGMQVAASRPLELVALVFEPHRTADRFEPVRRTLASAIDRRTLAEVLLQRRAEPALTLLPAWLAGYSSTGTSRQLLPRAAIAALPLEQRELVVRVDATDALAQAVAERVAVDARERGFSLKVQAVTGGLAPRADARIVRISLQPTTPAFALADVLTQLGPRAIGDVELAAGSDTAAVHGADAAINSRAIVIPLVHLQELYGLSEQVTSWTPHTILPTGVWNLSDTWLRSAKP